jgi:HEXXH motif-containing protein
MTYPTAHHVPSKIFAGLASGGGGTEAARLLAGIQFSKHVLLLRRIVNLANSTGHEEAAAATHAYDQLAAIQQLSPAAVADVIRHPAVGAWASQTVEALSSSENAAAARPAQMSALAVAAAIRSRSALSATVPVSGGEVMIPSLGGARATAGVVRVSPDETTIDDVPLPANLGVDSHAWKALRPVTLQARDKSITLVIDDLDPFRAPGAEDVDGRLDQAEVARWREVWLSGWDLLVSSHPVVADEVAAMISVLTPLRAPGGRSVSATARHAFGALMLSAPDDARSLALTMTHEVAHAKLSALLDLVPMTVRDDGRRFYAPWRDDPRPASGLLQGAYAFLGVAGFWLRQSEISDREAALAEFARWYGGVRRVVDTLRSSGQLTPAGDEFVAGIDGTLRDWEAVPVPAATLAKAKLASEEHEDTWRRRHGEIPAPVS